jgi:hypothetical protein
MSRPTSSYNEFVIHVSSFAKLDMRNATSRLSDADIRFRNIRLSIADYDQYDGYRWHCAQLVNVSCAENGSYYSTAPRFALLLSIDPALS